jgi:hypothetical protein
VVCPAGLAADGTATVQVTALNAVVEWSAAATTGLTVTPRHGVLKAGARGRISVSADTADAGSAMISFISNGGAATCRLSWNGDGVPDASDPPPDEPPASSSPTPSEAPSAQTPTELSSAAPTGGNS